ncbi:TolC family protein [Winogradskyella sp. DF17]|uniref:TolC family protein n=1 Tax=Winogradskyella pelagia TaxID=2819984 RepID=A0ABS3T161_9FLAO|nr:TolC family protein [Winogradskyella sp. DF17]MBO3115480.1 TolC family protein [Winogradskyella sp. DF17]
MKKIISILLVIFVGGFGQAQEAIQSFSLEEAITYALENNRNVKNASRDVAAAEEQKWETIATGLPQIDGNINYQNFLEQQVSVVPAEFFGGNPGDFEEVIFGTKQNVSASATLNQLIFDGSYIVGLQSVKVFLEISKNAKEKTELQVRQNVINAYGNVLLAIESEAILVKNRDVLRKNLDETTKIYENGLEEEESVEQLQITLSGIESLLKNATRLKTIAYQMFNITLGIDVNTNTVLTDSLENLAETNISLELLNAEENVEDNIDYMIAENDKTSKELLVKLEKSKALPQLTGFINGGYLGFSNEFTFLDSDQNWSGFSAFGINLNIPIFSSLGRTAKTQRAKIELEIAEESLTELEQQIRLEIARAKSDYQFSIEDYDIKKQNLKLAERIEKKNETKFFEGIGSSFELRQAQTQLYNAQSEYLQSMLNVITNKTQLETVLNRPN